MQKEKFILSSEIKEIIRNLTLFDDYFMSIVFDKNIPATELVLRIILNRKDIKVKSVIGQRTLKSPLSGGRSIKLDILAEDDTKKIYNIEIQKGDEGAAPKRARFHSSMVDVRMLKSGQKFNALSESYVIFITENDYYGRGLPIYTIDRHIKETDTPFNDGSHIIYVNGSYKGDDDIGRLMNDFRQKEVDKMCNEELVKSTGYFKNKEEVDMSNSALADYVQKVTERAIEFEREEAEKRENKIKEEAREAAKEASLSSTIKTALAYGIDKERIITRLCSEFNLSEEEANKEYDKYAVKTA